MSKNRKEKILELVKYGKKIIPEKRKQLEKHWKEYGSEPSEEKKQQVIIRQIRRELIVYAQEEWVFSTDRTLRGYVEAALQILRKQARTHDANVL